MKVLIVFGFVLLTLLVLGLLLAFPFMWLWNGSVCLALTIAKPIEYWTAYSLMMFTICFLSYKK